MVEQPDAPAPVPAGATPDKQPDEKKAKKKKDKVRAAWISFVGRIVAQFVGAAATIVLGLFLFQRYQAPHGDAGGAAETPTPEREVRVRRGVAIPGTTSLAVLPLQNFSADPQQEYFADGMTDALIADLAKINGLRVISRTSSMRYKDQRKPLPEIGQELGVDVIVEGSVAQADGRVRITAQLIDAMTDAHLWAQSYDRPLHDILTLQAEVATAIAQEINVTLTPPQHETLTRRRPVDPVAYDLYLKGRQSWALRTPEGFERAIHYFDQALAQDSAFAAAYAGLADAYSFQALPSFGALPARDAMSRAKAAAERAVALDPTLAEAHTSLAWMSQRHDWDWTGAERAFRRALELNPGYTTAYQFYSLFLAEQGRHDEALAHARRALDLDPLSPNVHRSLGVVHYYARRFDLAESAERRSLELEPDSVASRLILARSLIEQGKPEAAIKVCEGVPSWQNQEELLVAVGRAHSRAGRRARAEEILRQLLAREPPPSATSLARLYAELGAPDAAFQALDRAVAEHDDMITTLKADPVLDPLRPDPRFASLLKRVNLS